MASPSRRMRRKAEQSARREQARRAKLAAPFWPDNPEDDDQFIANNPQLHPHMKGYGAEADFAWTMGARPSDKNPSQSHLAQSLEDSGAAIYTGDNQFGPSFPGDTEWSWVLCYGCGLPFQYWGVFAITAENPSGKTILEDIATTVAAGPCPRCGAAGLPMDMHFGTGPDGSLSATSHPDFLNELHRLSKDLEAGKVDVRGASERLRSKGGVLARIGDWLEARPVTATAAIGLLGVIATIVTPYLHGEADRGLNDEQITQIVETVLEHYDEVNNRPTKPTRPRSKIKPTPSP